MTDPAKTNALQILEGVRFRLEGMLERATVLREKLDGEAALLQSMERLAAQARQSNPPPMYEPQRQQEDGAFLASDGWQIALINEEGQ